MENRIIIRQNHHGQAVLPLDFPSHTQHHLRRRPRLQRAHASRLNGRSISYRVRKRHPKLKNVHATINKRLSNPWRKSGLRVASSHVAYERAVALRLQLLENLGYPAHIFTPRKSATTSTSLSPRPDTVTTTVSSRFIFRANFMANATACEGSNAGIMPSSLDSAQKASTASLSVAETYSALRKVFRQECSGPTDRKSTRL